MDRRTFIGGTAFCLGSFCLSGGYAWEEAFLTLDQAKKILWGDNTSLTAVAVQLTKEQMRAIGEASKVRVRNPEIAAWRTAAGGWFILDQVIGKHENIDLAVAITPDGKVKGLEVLTYRESYGDEIRNPKWRAQFQGHGAEEPLLVLNRNIKNISGATLSCRHVTDGINRLLHTWQLVLRHLAPAE